MEQDPFAGSPQDASSTPGHGSAPGIDSEDSSATGYARDRSSEVPRGREEGGSVHTGHIRSFLEDQLRERPLPTLLLGVLAGWIAGKLLR